MQNQVGEIPVQMREYRFAVGWNSTEDILIRIRCDKFLGRLERPSVGKLQVEEAEGLTDGTAEGIAECIAEGMASGTGGSTAEDTADGTVEDMVELTDDLDCAEADHWGLNFN
jgi:hypothetical protein